MDDNNLFRSGFVQASPGGCRLACSPLHLGRLLVGRPLAAQAGTLLRADPQVQHLGPSGHRRAGTAQRQWPPSLRAGSGGGLAAGVDRFDLREARESPVGPQRGAARGRYSTLARDPARQSGRRSVSGSCLLGGPRSLRRRRQGHQTRQTAAQAVAWTAGRYSGRAGVGRLELADRHGGGHGRAPRRGGWGGEPHRSAAVDDGDGRWWQAVGGGVGSALLQSELPALGAGRRWPLPHPLLLQYPLCHRSSPSGAGEPRCPRQANRAGVGAVGQVCGASGAVRAPDHVAPGRRQGDQRDHGPAGTRPRIPRRICWRPTK